MPFLNYINYVYETAKLSGEMIIFADIINMLYTPLAHKVSSLISLNLWSNPRDKVLRSLSVSRGR